MKFFGSLKKLVSVGFEKNGQDLTLRPNQSTTFTAARDIQLPPGDADAVVVGAASTQTLTNKTISGASNTISNISLTGSVTGVLPVANGGTNSSTSLSNNRVIQSSSGAIVEAAAITAARALISDSNGIPTHSTVTDTELAYVSGVTSAIQTQLNATEKTANKGQNNGYASLDSGGKVPASQLPNSVMEFKGNWDASTNTPTLADGTGNAGDVYRANVAGSTDFGSGSITFVVGDWAVYNGTIWEKSHSGADSVLSVNGSTGVVTVNAINQLTGDVTTSAASGSQSLAATIAAGAVTASKLGTVTDGVTLDQSGAGSTLEVKAGGISNTQVSTSAAIAVSKLAAGTDTYVLTTVSGVPTWSAPASTVTTFKDTWATADTATKAITHSLGTTDIVVQIFDIASGETIEVDTVVRTSTSVVTVTASQAPPAGSWRVLIMAI